MRRTRIVVVLAVLAVMGVFAAEASPMYHPGMARFVQRDRAENSEGANLCEYVGGKPRVLVDPQGLWGTDVHQGASGAAIGTITWATNAGFGAAYADAMGRYDKKVDSDNPFTKPGTWHWHFNLPPARPPANHLVAFAVDTRGLHATQEMANALRFCISDGDAQKTAEALGTGLHPVQDYYAHGNWWPGRPTSWTQGRKHPFWYDWPHKNGTTAIAVPIESVDYLELATIDGTTRVTLAG